MAWFDPMAWFEWMVRPPSLSAARNPEARAWRRRSMRGGGKTGRLSRAQLPVDSLASQAAPPRTRPKAGRVARSEDKASPAGNAGLKTDEEIYYLICPETSLVISNMLTWLLPLKTGLSESSALIMVRFFLS